MIKNYVKNTRFYIYISSYRRISLRLRFINWFVQKFIYGTKSLTFSLHFASRITHPDKAYLSKSSQNSLAHKGGCYLECSNGVFIGEGTIIAAGVKIISANHKIDDLSKHEIGRPIRIGRNCWLGANAIILSGVELGDEI